MRRKDREITESDRIQKIIDACQCMRIALADGACAYICLLYTSKGMEKV